MAEGDSGLDRRALEQAGGHDPTDAARVTRRCSASERWAARSHHRREQGDRHGCPCDAPHVAASLTIIRQVHDKAATQQDILGRLSTEVAKLRAGDHFVFWNSSHGYQVNDRSGDELFDFVDEAICTYDTDPRNPLTDDKFGRIISRADPKAVVFFGSDSCHSGTVTRNPHPPEGERQARLWIPPDDVRARTGESLLKLGDYVPGVRAGRHAREEVRRFGRFRRQAPEQDMHHLLLSGCRAEEVSYDAKFPQGFHGAMTYNFAMAVLGAWKDKRAITYAQAHKAAVAGLKKGGYDQSPQLEGPQSLKRAPVFGHKP